MVVTGVKWWDGSVPVGRVFAFHGASSATAVLGVEVATHLALWAVLATLEYHTEHQLGAVREILARHTRVSPLRLDAIYRFSWLTARTAIGISLVPLLYLWASAALIEVHPA